MKLMVITSGRFRKGERVAVYLWRDLWKLDLKGQFVISVSRGVWR